MVYLRFLCLLCLFFNYVFDATASEKSSSFQDEHAAEIYNRYQDSIFQIRVVDQASNNKTSIGSGFLIDAEGRIATNYHVVSSKVQEPNRYRLEIVLNNSESGGELDILDIDIVHDLAIVRNKAIKAAAFRFGDLTLTKGAHLYSLGDPHDLGMSIIEGTYNGLLENSLYDKIFFSGSLNPGMSGGPTVDPHGKIVGVNVSTAGNQLSFLVPAKYLRKLYQSSTKDQTATLDFNEIIQQQLQQTQADNISELLAASWPSSQLDHAILPGKIHRIFKCWGDTDNDPDEFIQHTFSHCASEDDIFINDHFSTGSIAYSYDLYTNAELSQVHFYNLYSKRFGQSLRANMAHKEDVHDYDCHLDFVSIANKDWKLALCARQYKKYASLYDVSAQLALVSEPDKGMILQIALAGVDQTLSMAFIKKFLESIAWQE